MIMRTATTTAAAAVARATAIPKTLWSTRLHSNSSKLILLSSSSLLLPRQSRQLKFSFASNNRYNNICCRYYQYCQPPFNSRRNMSTINNNSNKSGMKITKYNARVFVHNEQTNTDNDADKGKGVDDGDGDGSSGNGSSSSGSGSGAGGNPVTIFDSRDKLLSLETQQSLAQTCDWESVFTYYSSNNDKNLSFFMPSGEQVEFCAHAALGAMVAAASSSSQNNNNNERKELSFTTTMTNQTHSVQIFQKVQENDSDNKIKDDNNNNDNNINISKTTSKHKMARLDMTVPYSSTSLTDDAQKAMLLQRTLRDQCNLQSNQYPIKHRFPTLMNASIARNKTLIFCDSARTVHKAEAPSITASNSKYKPQFEYACQELNDSTGFYIYAPRDPNYHYSQTLPDLEKYGWECRQFPKSSGYPEDPATGIAAAALAVSIFRYSSIYLPVYNFYQGTAMGKPSLIQVLDIVMPNDTTVSFGLQGQVEIDSQEEITV